MIEYTSSLEGLLPEHLHGFFVGWPHPPTPETLLKLLQNSYRVVFAKEGARVIGFVQAVGDGVLSAYIPLLEVLPEYQGRGVGTELMRRLLADLSHLYMVDLLCDEEVQPFYARLGLKRAGGMMIRNYARQAGE